ncbi:uncharacterized protein LOC131218054 [Magnolia sinica]|uniref:uncharacterized protein LOC131218054 n=1 Tax=Magnolia sinica TaxID=86752 RepID=UPI00265B1A1B|nr:uncharacterized protein LOC131218054 [Magnolia sinica]
MTKYGMTMARQTPSFSEVTSHPETSAAGSNGGSDGNLLPITGHKPNGQNYLLWSQSVMMFICGKGRDDYLTEVAAPPSKEDPKYRTWKLENNMVMSWFINSMTNEIGENFLLYGTAKDIWVAAKETYSSFDNSSELFAIESILHDLRQGDLTVTQYFNALTQNWQELDMFEEYDWKCPEDGIKYRKIIEKKRLYKFLLGLNKDLDEVRGRIMGLKPLPSIQEAFSEVRMEESRKKVMMGPPTTNHSPEGYALSV